MHQHRVAVSLDPRLEWFKHQPILPALAKPLYQAAIDRSGSIPSGVAVCLRADSAKTFLEVLLIQRAGTLRDFPNVWGFPGGKLDRLAGDHHLVDTALRELYEETALLPLEALKVLTPVPTYDRKYIMTPTVFLVDAQAPMTPNPEIARYRWCSMDHLWGRSAHFFNSLPYPTRCILVESAARLKPAADLLPSPTTWFVRHHDFNYSYRQWASALYLAELYPHWMRLADTALSGKGHHALAHLSMLHRQQSQHLEALLRRLDPDFEQRAKDVEAHPSFYLKTLLALEDLNLIKAQAWTRADWKKALGVLYVMYQRGLERYLGLRRVDHVQCPLAQNVDYWFSQTQYGALMIDAFYNARLLSRAVPQLNEQLDRHRVWEKEATLMKEIFRN